MVDDSDDDLKPPCKKKDEHKGEKNKEEGKKKKRKYSSSEESSEGGYNSKPSNTKPVPIEEPVKEDPLTKPQTSNVKKAPPKPEPKRVFVDEDDSDDALGRWNS